MKNFDYITNPAKLLTPEIVQMVGSIHEHKGKQELFLEANIDELKTLLEVALIQSTGASNRIEGIFTSDKRLKELVSQKAERTLNLWNDSNPISRRNYPHVEYTANDNRIKGSLFNVKVWMKLLVKKKGPYPFWI